MSLQFQAGLSHVWRTACVPDTVNGSKLLKNPAKATAEAMRAFSFLQLHLTVCLGATH